MLGRTSLDITPPCTGDTRRMTPVIPDTGDMRTEKTHCDKISIGRFNLNDSISYYLASGVPKDQIVVGLATFGHGWILKVRPDNSLIFVRI